MKKFIPTWHAENIYQIEIDFYLKNNIKFVFSDLDNTLDAYDVLSPSDNAKQLVNKMHGNGIELIIISNNHSDRVKNYSNDLGVKCLYSAHKPFKKRLLKFLKINEINISNAIIIGDQTVTDIRCANNCKIKSILVDKLVERDQKTTKFNRFFDKRIRKSLKNKNLLNEIIKE